MATQSQLGTRSLPCGTGGTYIDWCTPGIDAAGTLIPQNCISSYICENVRGDNLRLPGLVALVRGIVGLAWAGAAAIKNDLSKFRVFKEEATWVRRTEWPEKRGRSPVGGCVGGRGGLGWGLSADGWVGWVGWASGHGWG